MTDQTTTDEALDVEGLAGQLYVQQARGQPFAWWHVLREDIRAQFRAEARAKIADFNSRNAF